MDYIDKRFGDFIRKAKTMGLIDTKLEYRITNGRTWGNLGAHYVPTIDERVVRSMNLRPKENMITPPRRALAHSERSRGCSQREHQHHESVETKLLQRQAESLTVPSLDTLTR